MADQEITTPEGETMMVSDKMKAFITHAQSFNPTIPTDLHNYIVAKYVEKRKF